MQFMDKLFDSVKRNQTCLCVGFDPVWEKLPDLYHEKTPSLSGNADAVTDFGFKVLPIIKTAAAAIKFNLGFFLQLGSHGLASLTNLVERAKYYEIPTILDGKFGDIANSAATYAGFSYDIVGADAVTVNPYMGREAILQFARQGRGVFVLCRTSNNGSSELQDHSPFSKPITSPTYKKVIDMVYDIGVKNISNNGYSNIGLVIGANFTNEMKMVRRYGSVPMLIPGYGSQGGMAVDAMSGINKETGLGCIVNSSRGCLSAFEPGDRDWLQKTIDAVNKAKTELNPFSSQAETINAR